MTIVRTALLVVAFALGTLSALPSDAEQTPKVRRIGFLAGGAPPPASASPPIVQGLRELGYVEGQNLTIEYRYAEGKIDRLPDLAAELVHLRVEIIVVQGYPAAHAAKQATATIPIVIVSAGDPVGTGLVASLARPGGNITGVSFQETELSGKRLELLKEAVPRLSRVAVLWNTADLGMSLRSREIQAAARALGLTLQPLGVREPSDFDGAFSAMARERPDALFVVADPLTTLNRRRILDFAAKGRLPAMYEFSSYVNDGGLMAYGPSFSEMSRRAAVYVDKVLKGARPADLPVEQPTRFELAVNLKTAKALGLTIPPSIMVRADQVIQ